MKLCGGGKRFAALISTSSFMPRGLVRGYSGGGKIRTSPMTVSCAVWKRHLSAWQGKQRDLRREAHSWLDLQSFGGVTDLRPEGLNGNIDCFKFPNLGPDKGLTWVLETRQRELCMIPRIPNAHNQGVREHRHSHKPCALNIRMGEKAYFDTQHFYAEFLQGQKSAAFMAAL